MHKKTFGEQDPHPQGPQQSLTSSKFDLRGHFEAWRTQGTKEGKLRGWGSPHPYHKSLYRLYGSAAAHPKRTSLITE